MKNRARALLFTALLLFTLPAAHAVDARFDLVGPKIDVRVTRGDVTLPIASVPNLQPGDKLWIHPDLPQSQSVKYLLICAFLRGTTNPPPENWFIRIDTWKKEIRDEGVFVTVPQEAQQAVLFMAPETGGDFGTLKSAVRGRPGVFVRASQDLNEAGFEQARIERYLADIRRVPPSDPAELQRRSDLLARTLALKPNADCFKRPIDFQFTCLTQTGTQTLLDDSHQQNIVTALSNGQNSDFIQAASYTGLAGAGVYSAYVGAIVDLIRIMGNLHTAQYQYIPAIAFPQGDALNLRLNTPPSFHNPKSVLVVGLPSVQPAQKPPLRPADANDIACLLKPKVVLAIEGAPLVFSTDFATSLVLHLNTPPGAPAEPDIPLLADAFEGGLVLQHGPEHHVPLRDDPGGIRPVLGQAPSGTATLPPAPAPTSQPTPVRLTGTIRGRWGFDTFTGPTVPLQQLPGGDWHVVSQDGSASDLIAGKSAQLFLDSTGSACVHTVSAQAPNSSEPLTLPFHESDHRDRRNLLVVDLPDGRHISPGNLRLQIQQYGQPSPNAVATEAFSDPPHIEAMALPAADKTLLLTGSNLGSIQKVTLGDLVFRPVLAPVADSGDPGTDTGNVLRLTLPADANQPPTHAGDKLSAQVVLNDGRRIPMPLTVLPARPVITLLGHTSDPLPGSNISLASPDDLPLAAHLTFTLKSHGDFPRNGRVEVETSDGTLRTVLTLAPSGGLVLQDPRTVVASLDPLSSFGPSAFGTLHLRAVFPPGPGKGRHALQDGAVNASSSSTTPISGEAGVLPVSASQAVSSQDDPTRESDWIPLGTLVRLPSLAHLQCSSDVNLPCSLTGQNLFLIQAVSADPAFADADPVPDGFTGGALPVPHPAGSSGTLFVKLRDDPTPIDAATLAMTPVTNQASTSHTRGSSSRN